MSEVTVQITRNNQIVIPSEILEKAGIGVGSILKFELREGGIFLKQVPSRQAACASDEKWFWTEEWQSKEREADKSIVNGEMVGPFDDIDEALEALKTAKL
ncbi:MAG: AbrB/MazE/SpoVT family DNA-binding domain-containing protein [Candidatus Poribacteria bacterium]